jgi:apolipoprotein N-acyltransferase
MSGGLLWLCHYPVAAGWLGWVALVPLLGLARTTIPSRRLYVNGWTAGFVLNPAASSRRRYFYAWLAGFAFYVPALQWVRVADPMMYFAWIALAFYCSLFFVVALWLIRFLDRRSPLPLVLAVPLVWTGLEFLRAHLITGFAWYFLGHTQHQFLPLIQIADLTGAYGVTFIVAAVNAILFEALATRPWFRSVLGLEFPQFEAIWPLRIQTACVASLLAGVLMYGYVRLGQTSTTPGPRVALIQGNLDQRLRNQASFSGGEAARMVVSHYRKLSDAAARQTPRPDLIVWPETSFPGDWVEVSPQAAGCVTTDIQEEAAATRDLAQHASLLWGPNVLLGMGARIYDSDRSSRHYNSAILIGANGQVPGRYDKIHRVVFGEYVPLEDWFPFLAVFIPYDSDYSIREGEHLTRFPLQTADGNYRFGVLICFEDSDAVLARHYVRQDSDGPPVDFLVNISNDGWFNGTSEHEEHLAICRFRAVETRRSVVRAVNMGISAVIDGDGRIIDLPRPTWAESKKVEAVVTAQIPIDKRYSLYAEWGDWFPWSCWGMVALGLMSPLGRRNRQA